jgi:hypothetical protein
MFSHENTYDPGRDGAREIQILDATDISEVKYVR